MIVIREGITKKMPGITSAYFSYPYNDDITNIIKTCSVSAAFHRDTLEWEVPISEVAKLIDTLYKLDSITVIPFQEEVSENKEEQIELLPHKTKPYYYQEDAVRYGLQHDSWLLLDQPGLGKTKMMIDLAAELKERENIQHCLVICGVNTLKNNWKKEIGIHSDLSCRILGERRRKNGNLYIGSIKDRVDDLKNTIDEFFVITNVETLRDEKIIKELTKGKSNTFDMIVADEIHKLKSPTSIQGKNFLKLTDAKYKIGLTGTLLTNSPIDAFVPLKWIGKERANFSTFKYYYSEYGGLFNHDLIGYRNMKYLKNQLSTCSLRRTKEILNLPPKTIIHECVDMNNDQETFYNNIIRGVLDEVDKVEISDTNIVAMMTRLRQATACPSILTSENISSAKIDRACDICEEVVSGGDKIVIFSTFKQTLDVLNDRLKQFNPLLCTGDIPDSVISSNIDKFQNESYNKVMLATWQKMGVGLTITAASYAVFIDCPYTAGDCEQVEDRVHRIGSKNPVFIYYLWCTNSVDERVKEIVEDKSIVSNYVIDNKCAPKLSERLRKIIVDLK